MQVEKHVVYTLYCFYFKGENTNSNSQEQEKGHFRLKGRGLK